ncbi:DUF2946 family protein [Luteimonas sp. A478]
MNPASTSFRRTALVALLATLMAALAPAASRMLSVASAGCDAAAPCATATDGSAHSAHHPADENTSPQLVDDACGYCLLVAPPPRMQSPLWLPASQQAEKPSSPLHIVRLRPNRNVRGLGSQAPPPAA